MLSARPRRVVITGIGVVSPNGIGSAAFTDALRSGRSGVRTISSFDTSMLKTQWAGCLSGFDPQNYLDERDIRRVPPLIPMAVAASKEALAMAGLPIGAMDLDLSRQIGVSLGTGGGGISFIEGQYRAYFTGEGKYSPFTITSGTHGNLSSELSIQLGLRGQSHVTSTGCASSTDALGYACMHIQHGATPVVLAGGADSPITECTLKAFELMRILAGPRDPIARTSRPFSKDRDGFVLGEGSWMFVLEDGDFAAKRGAKPLAEILGWGSTCDAFHRVQPSPDCTESVRAIELALAQAVAHGVTKDNIDYVNLHGTSTQMNDALETLAMKKTFGERAKEIPMSATKSMIGHPQGACGAAGIAATILGIRNGFLHPTINLNVPDPDCDLDYIPHQARSVEAAKSHVALCNCIAFGSKNSALLIRTLGI